MKRDSLRVNEQSNGASVAHSETFMRHCLSPERSGGGGKGMHALIPIWVIGVVLNCWTSLIEPVVCVSVRQEGDWAGRQRSRNTTGSDTDSST